MTVATGFQARLIEEAEGIVAQAAREGIEVRVMGGVGIRLLLGSSIDPAFIRGLRDIDVLVRRRDAPAVERLLGGRGWEPAREFNALNGARRLLFHDPQGDAQVDVFVEAFEMAHRLPLAAALDAPGPSLPATDLLMTKLQIVELNAKDRGDLYALLIGSEVGDSDPTAIEPARVAELTSRDWGLQHTFELNLARLLDGLDGVSLSPESVTRLRSGVEAIRGAMDAAPKTRGWKIRARIGERKRWYDEPEEVDRSPDDPG